MTKTRAMVLLLLAILAGLAGGCTSRTASVPPKLLVEAVAHTEHEAITVHRIIARNGPGSWTNNALWEEFVVTISNTGETPIACEKCVLYDITDAVSLSSSDCKRLVEGTQQNWRRYAERKVDLERDPELDSLRQSGGATVAKGTFAAALVIVNPVQLLFLPVAIPLAAAAQERISKGLQQRAISLPLEVQAQHAEAGSLFFPLTVGPKRLVVSGRRGDQPFTLEVPLPELTNLHLRRRNA